MIQSQVMNTIDPMQVEKVKGELCDDCKSKMIKLFKSIGKAVLINPNAFAKGFYKSLCPDCKGRVLKVVKK
jgi:uncharacterized protein with PIN domain